MRTPTHFAVIDGGGVCNLARAVRRPGSSAQAPSLHCANQRCVWGVIFFFTSRVHLLILTLLCVCVCARARVRVERTAVATDRHNYYTRQRTAYLTFEMGWNRDTPCNACER